MTETLWTKYAGKPVSLETIYKDDYIPTVKELLKKGKSITDSLMEALTSIGCQLPFGVMAPIGWVSKARDEISRGDREKS